MRDPYLYDDIPVLRNKLGIRNQNLLDNAEADYVVYRLKDLALTPLSGDYHTEPFRGGNVTQGRLQKAA